MDDERAKALALGHLEGNRAHVLAAVEGLDDAALRRAVLPSGWSVLGMLQHLTYDDEVFWFQAVVAGDAAAIEVLQTPEAHDSWTVPDDADPATVVAAYRAAVDRANAIVAATPLDAAPAWWPGDLFGDWRLDSLHEILLHVVTEVACHAGHLDAARELLDGRQFLVLAD